MSRQDFLSNLWRTGDRFYLRRIYPRRQDDGSRSLEDMIANAKHWLTPETVAGYQIDDFPELDEPERSELENWVRQFRDIAEAFGSNLPVSESLIINAYMNLTHIGNFLQADLPLRHETLKINTALRRINYPESVQFIEFEIGADSTGDPAVWIWVVMDDEAARRKTFSQESSKIDRQLREALSAAGIDRWPYIRYRTLSEQLAVSSHGAP